MPDEPITQDEINDLLTKLQNTPDLVDSQRALLHAILRIAADVEIIDTTETATTLSFVDEFGAAFTPGKAQFLIGYAASHTAGGFSGLDAYVAKGYVAKTHLP
jgi:hypothetical protein